MPKLTKYDYLAVAVVVVSVAWGAYCIYYSYRGSVDAEPNIAARNVESGAFVDAVNRYREKHRLPPVASDVILTKAAEHTATENARAGRLFHQPGISAEIIAENGRGFEFAVKQWDKSPGHRAILSDPKYKRVGCACVRGRDGRFYCCARFM